MIKDLIKVANRLDSLNLKKEANVLDEIIKKIAGEQEGHTTIGSSRFDEIKKAEATILNLTRSEDPIVNQLGVICYYAMFLALTKVPSTPQAKQGSPEQYKQFINEATQTIISSK